jgi:hypothetical protein
VTDMRAIGSGGNVSTSRDATLNLVCEYGRVKEKDQN